MNATAAHAGQLDKGGQPYIHHPIHVSKVAMEIVRSRPGYDEAFCCQVGIVGFLHDILEDTKMTAEDFRKAGIPEEYIVAVQILTKDKTESYEKYLDKVSHNKLAAVVKIVDMTHNCDLSRLQEVTPEDLKRAEKYKKAIKYKIICTTN